MTAPADRPVVLKVGGELLESPAARVVIADAIGRVARRAPLVVVHGGGREIDADLKRRGIPKRAIDGLRITDPDTLESAVSILAGTLNTELVATLVARGVPGVGLTGADAAIAPVQPAPLYPARDGTLVSLGRVGQPCGWQRPALLAHLLAGGYVPVVACLGIGAGGHLFNVNADTLAAHLAIVCGASELVLAGGTAGVLDAAGATIASLAGGDIDALIEDGTASAGMIAKLAACRAALARGVPLVRIVDGRTLARGVPAGTSITVDGPRADAGLREALA